MIQAVDVAVDAAGDLGCLRLAGIRGPMRQAERCAEVLAVGAVALVMAQPHRCSGHVDSARLHRPRRTARPRGGPRSSPRSASSSGSPRRRVAEAAVALAAITPAAPSVRTDIGGADPAILRRDDLEARRRPGLALRRVLRAPKNTGALAGHPERGRSAGTEKCWPWLTRAGATSTSTFEHGAAQRRGCRLRQHDRLRRRPERRLAGR